MDGRNPDDMPLSAAVLAVVAIVVARPVAMARPQTVSKETIDVGLSFEAADDRSAPEDELRSSGLRRCRG